MARKNSQSTAPEYPGKILEETTASNELVNQPEPELDDITEVAPDTLKASDIADDDSSGNDSSDDDSPTDIQEAEPEEKPSEEGLVKELFFGRPAEVRSMYPKGCVKWDSFYSDLDFNIRDKSDSYSPESLAGISISLAEFGQEEAVLLSQRDNGDRITLRGNRRRKAMEMHRNEDLKLVAAGKLDKSQVRWQYVRAEIRTGLTLAQETILMLDHGPRMGLRPPEIFQAVLRLVRLGWNETQCIKKLGYGKDQRSKVATHFKAAKLGLEVQAAYAKYLSKDTDAMRMSAPVINGLYAAMTTDRKSKAPAQMGGGPAFRKEWEKVKLEDGNGSSRSQGVKKNVEDAQLRCMGEHPLLVDLFNHMLNKTEGVMNLDDIISNISRACNEMFPQDADEVTTVTEEGITREI